MERLSPGSLGAPDQGCGRNLPGGGNRQGVAGRGDPGGAGGLAGQFAARRSEAPMRESCEPTSLGSICMWSQ